jgi:hypothetical protein
MYSLLVDIECHLHTVLSVKYFFVLCYIEMENVIGLMQELSQTLKVVVLVGMGPDIFTYGSTWSA